MANRAIHRVLLGCGLLCAAALLCAETVGLNAAEGPATGSGRKLEGDLWNIENHTVGIGERKGAKRDGAVEIEDKTGLPCVTREAGVRGGREIHPRSRQSGGRDGGTGGRSLGRARADRFGAQ